MKNFGLILLFLANIGSVFSQKEKLMTLEQLFTKKKYNHLYNAMELDLSVPHPEVYRMYLSYDWNDSLLDLKPEFFPNLQELQISGEKIRFIPNGLEKFKKLQVLDLRICTTDGCRYNTACNIPDELFELQHLKILSLHGFPAITYLPEKIGKLKELVSLFIYTNYSFPYFLPVSLAYMPKLKSISIWVKDDLLNTCTIGYGDINHFNNTDIVHFYPMYYKHIGTPEIELELIESSHIFSDFTIYYYGIDNLSLYTEESNLKPISAGEVVRYYDNGQKSIVGTIDSLLRPMGNWNYYYKNGKLKEERFYENGKETGQWSLYDSLGTLISHYQFNEDNKTSVFYYFPNGKLVADYHFINNKREGKWHAYHPSGELIYEFNYKYDMLEGQSYYHTDYGATIRTNYHNGFKNGVETILENDGTMSERYYIKGENVLKEEYDLKKSTNK